MTDKLSNRCKKCDYKSSFLIKCKCNSYYCIKHLLPEIHNCVAMDVFKKEAYSRNEKVLLIKKEKPEWIEN